jgi:adenine deaminase
MTSSLVDTAMGKLKADLVIRNASLVNVNTREILQEQDVAVKKDRIALVGNADHTIGNATEVLNANGRYLVPGFIDGHVHIESAMVTASEFAKAVVPRGTTTVFIDPHEIANVLGMNGVRFFLREANGLPLKILVTFPSCVPAAPGYETNGATIGLNEVEEALRWKGVVALGEMMNYPGVISGDPQVHSEIAATLRAGRVVEGHAVDLYDRKLAAYAASGITSCHESTRKIQAVQRLRFGMYAMFREASASHDIAETVRSITEEKLDSRHACLVTDDRDPSGILREGHIDYVIRRAIDEGVDPVTAIQMATLNTAEHYECARELGSIAPARYADMVILDKLETVSVDTVIADGKVVSERGNMVANLVSPTFPDFVRHTIHLRQLPNLIDLKIPTKTSGKSIRVRAIGVNPTTIITHGLESETQVKNGEAIANPDDDILKIAVLERHRATGNIGNAFVKGFGLKEGAVASTVAHDSHNLVVAGANATDMLAAIKFLVDSDGGLIVVNNGKSLAHVPLPIAGLMSDMSVKVVSRQIQELKEALSKMGCTLPAPYMTLAFTTLSLIPELRITDKGLLDTVNFKFVSPVIE